jgi:hypothetical protein
MRVVQVQLEILSGLGIFLRQYLLHYHSVALDTLQFRTGSGRQFAESLGVDNFTTVQLEVAVRSHD